MKLSPDSIKQRLEQHFTPPPACIWQQQGYFSYQLNGRLTDIIEPWRIGRVPFISNNSIGGNPHTAADLHSTVIQSLRHSRQYQLLLTADWQQRCQQQQCVLYWQQGDSPGVTARYQLSGQSWYCEQAVTRQQGELCSPWHFFPLLRVFSGAMLLALEQGPTQLILPDIEVDTVPADKLRPKLDTRQSQAIESTAQDTRCFIMTGGHYREDNAVFTLNEAGLLLSYQWQQDDRHCWQVTNHLLPPSLDDAAK